MEILQFLAAMAEYANYQLQFPYTLILLFSFGLFAASWRAWLILLVLLAPVYVSLIVIIWAMPITGDRHGFISVFFGLQLPLVCGHLARSASLFVQGKGWSRQKALTIDFASLLVTIAIVYGFPRLELITWEWPELQEQAEPQKTEPLPKIE
ncbi:MAG: hypothetical protein LJE67_04605 [Salaquimonas sp.]|nr:hypothetical protein [Salaquimonas sp.]